MILTNNRIRTFKSCKSDHHQYHGSDKNRETPTLKSCQSLNHGYLGSDNFIRTERRHALNNPEVQNLIEQLQNQLARTLQVLDGLSEKDLARQDSHGCAVGQTLGGLIAHNIEHDRMHAGQIATKRWELGVMQGDPAQRMLAELVRERALLISTLIGLPDSALDKHTAVGETSIREVIEHVLYWEKDSIEHAAENVLKKDL